MHSLKKGDIFTDTDNLAKKVTAIYEDVDGNLIIDTIQPAMEEVVAELYIPDQTIKPNIDNIVEESLYEGVTIDRDPNKRIDVTDIPLKISVDLFDLIKGVSIADSAKNKMKDLFLPSKDDTEEDNEDEEEKSDEDKEKEENLDKTSREGLEKGAKPSLTLDGEIKLKDIEVNIGAKTPSLGKKQHSKTVHTWFGSHTVHWWTPTEVKGYVNLSTDFKMQYSLELKGKLSAHGSVRIPLGEVIIPLGPIGEFVQGVIGIYAQVRLNGSISLSVAYIQTDLVNMYAHTDLELSRSSLFKVSHPSSGGSYDSEEKKIEIEGIAMAELRMGPSIGLDFVAWGLPLAGAEIYAGQYTHLEGKLGVDIILYPKLGDIHPYGLASYEFGAFASLDLDVLSRSYVVNILDQKLAIISDSVGFKK